jgi:GNAT superfamily N-acetyltransferase
LSVRIAEAGADRRALTAFLALPRQVYRGDSWYCAPSRASVVANLERPAFAARQRLLLALEDGRPVARLAARLAPNLVDEAGRPSGTLVFFEALDRPQAVAALFADAVSRLREAGAGPIVGPMDGDTWHRYRVNAGPFVDPPFLLEPYNPPYYPRLFEANGFATLERYASTRVEDLPAVRAHLEAGARRALDAGYRWRALDPRRFAGELRLLYRLSAESFAGNFLYTAIDEREFLALYAGMRPVLDPRLVLFALAPDGAEVGFLFAYPDRFRAVAALGGRSGLLARLRFRWHRGEATAVNVKTLGVLPGHRRSGVGAALLDRAYEQALALGFAAANHCLFREDNPSARLDGGHGRLLRRYRLYRLGPEDGR